jgi:phosphatidylinositol dimannoside acyltransferase
VSVRGRLRDAGYAAGWRLVRVLPRSWAMAAFRYGADLAARRGGAGVRQLRNNLRRVVPDASDAELDELVRAGLRSYARYWCEAFRLPSMDHEHLQATLGEHIEGLDHLDKALAQGNGAILALPHSGNWDIAGVFLVGHLRLIGQSGRFATVAERLRPESLYRRFVAYRESLGFEILPLTGGAEPVLDVLTRRLRDNNVVCLVADRDLTPAGVHVEFFGEQAKMPAGPARLARQTGAALLPVGCWFTEGGWGFRVHPAVNVTDVTGTTQAVADAFAADITEHPEDWHMLQRLWPADRRLA